MTASNIHYFGVRHHGPGSSHRLLEALEQLQPDYVLIEGPADCIEVFRLLAHPKMKPPVAMLSYEVDQTDNSIFYPFADFSPEYQACLWAEKNQKSMALIDLPASIRLAVTKIEIDKQLEEMKRLSELSDEDADDSQNDESNVNESNENKTVEDETIEAEAELEQDNELDEQNALDEQKAYYDLCRDPIGVLAYIAGYQDAESWWNDMIEQNQNDNLDIFSQIDQAMTALRESLPENLSILADDLQREAFMRLEIAKVAKECDGTIAVVCGAWHVPALKEKFSAKHDRDLLKALPKKLPESKYKSTFVPWTSPRLASEQGYSAGVSAPMWYQHLWDHRTQQDYIASWLVLITHAMRKEGLVISTASVIEAQRLCTTLAGIRGRPSPSFEDINDAVISCLCFGEGMLWQQVKQSVLLGNEVGTIPDGLELVPLLEDLQKLQKKYKLKAEALPKEYSLDLRTDIGQNKSTLLHRLSLLEVEWGSFEGSGSSRGTFREKWTLEWKPEHAIQLVDNLIYGGTIEQAANNKVMQRLAEETRLATLADLVHICLTAQLKKATDFGLNQLTKRAGHVIDCNDLLDSISPLITLSRYGTARKLEFSQIDELTERLVIQASLALPYACRNLNHEESNNYRQNIEKAHQALLLHFEANDVLDQWWKAIDSLTHSDQSSFLLIGVGAKLLYQGEKLSKEQLSLLLDRMLSPAFEPANSAQFFEGFFTGMADYLLHDSILLSAINTWLLQLEETIFIEFLPLFRRVLSGLDSMERKRLFDTLFNTKVDSDILFKWDDSQQEIWQQQFLQLDKLSQHKKDWLA